MNDDLKNVVIFSDGGSRGNPGPGAGGGVVYFDEGKKILADAFYYGHCTNNQAEYRALLDAINLLEQNYTGELIELNLNIFLDSELMVKQINGEYQVRNDGLKEYYSQIQEKLSCFGQTTITHVVRANNQLADSLVNAALDRWAE
ncbi:MAG: ribonuclease HI family protein [Patescibacteria group bacterium]